MSQTVISNEENKIAQAVYEASQEVLTELGPGLLESAYEACLEFELKNRGFQVERQLVLPLSYKNLSLDEGFRIDLWVNRKVIIELKSVSEIKDIHYAQLNTYLRLTGCSLGLLINFNVRFIGEGFKRWIVRAKNS